MDSMTMMAKRFNSTGNAETLTAEGLNTHIRKRAADIRDMAGGETEAHAYLRFVEKEAEGRELFKAAKSAPTGEAEPEPPEYDRFTGLQKRDAETVPMQALMALADDHAKANPGAHPGKSIAHAMSTTAGQALYSPAPRRSFEREIAMTTGFVTRSQGKSLFAELWVGDALVMPVQDGLTAVHPGAQSTAVQLKYRFNRLSIVANSGDGAALPYAIAGNFLLVVNDGAAPAKIYGNNAGTDTIDGVAGATGVTLTNAKRAFFFCLTSGAWQSLAGAASA